MTKTTTIYLGATDVVLNADTPDAGSGWDIWNSAFLGDNAYFYSPQLIAALNDLNAREDIEFRWLTSWDREARDLISPAIGLEGEGWRIVERQEPTGSRKLSKSSLEYWWKLDAFKADIMAAPIKRLIWIDPDIDDHENEIDNWMDPYGVLEENRLYITPGRHGLTADHIKQIYQFLDEN